MCKQTSLLVLIPLFFAATVRANADSYAVTHETGDMHPLYQRESEKGTANGYAGLDGAGLVPVAQLPGLPAAWGSITGTLSAQTDLQSALDGKTATGHAHAASDVTSGTVATARLGSGTADSTKFLRGDQTWAAPPEAFPVGSVFIGVVSTNPGTLLGYGTWSAFGAGRVLVGRDAGDTDFDVAEETGGAKTHTLTTAEMPAHGHTQDAHGHTQNAHTHALTELRDATTGGATTNIALTADTSSTLGTKVSGSTTATNNTTVATNQNTGGGGAHNNLQPYIVVYMWKRTA